MIYRRYYSFAIESQAYFSYTLKGIEYTTKSIRQKIIYQISYVSH